MRIWFCNQNQCWNLERREGVVCAVPSDDQESYIYRQMVGHARQGDVVVHYAFGYIVALSRAKMDAVAQFVSFDDDAGTGCWYDDDGWLFETEYVDFAQPIPRDQVSKPIVLLGLHDSPFQPNGWLKPKGYFFPFSVEALRIIRQASPEAWPDWAEAALQRSS
jgi:hypothetical protein